MNWLDTTLIVLITAFTAIPICVFLHEIGHAIGALFLTKSSVQIICGSLIKIADVRIGRLEMRLFLLPGFVGYCRWCGKISQLSSAIISISGPLASALTCFICLLVYSLPNFHRYVYVVTLTSSMISFANLCLTLIPFNYPRWLPLIGGIPSDGLQAIMKLKNIRKANKINSDGQRSTATD